ncbi:hypothetical protein G9U51_06975 [Calidifontibacter sp. DB0510]|uniref:Lipoprotein n=1 Tax=Metallococcus carri TaxID=1656884 RepID=A0A967AZY8_9MICO|nr:hypothetical protein [Metallococcus carri]NHN55522.1 hypothetical protein [Metallococcus carri]NOP38294.1 hypothetical protein [Calidifontibacter sp. DB2511S]
MNRSRLRRSPLPAVALAAVAATGLSGCMYFSPQQTTKPYIPADGNIASVGPVQLTNVLVVTSGKGADGKLQGLATNTSNKPVQLKVQPQGGAATTLTVPAMTSVRLDGKTNGNDTATVPAVSVAKVPVVPGKEMTITFTITSSGSSNPVGVPVLLDQPPYGTATPSGQSSSAEGGKEG